MNTSIIRSTAVPAPSSWPDQGVAWHYGDPFGEQRALAAGAALVDLSNRGVVRVSGSDRRGWLHSLTTQDLTKLKPGASALALILDPRGRILFELQVVEDGEQIWLIVEPSQVEQLLAYLTSMRFLQDVDCENLSDEYAVVGSGSGQPNSVYPTWVTPVEYANGSADRGGSYAKYVPERPICMSRAELVVPRPDLARLLDQADSLAGTWAWEAQRIAAGVPRMGLDIDSRAIPHEVGWIGAAVHLKKGCYRGQETVARVHNLGRPPRRLVLLHLDGTAERLPNPGDAVSWDGSQIGVVGSTAQHYELGPIALAVVKRDVPVAADLLVHCGTPDNDPVLVAARQQLVVAQLEQVEVQPRRLTKLL